MNSEKMIMHLNYSPVASRTSSWKTTLFVQSNIKENIKTLHLRAVTATMWNKILKTGYFTESFLNNEIKEAASWNDLFHWNLIIVPVKQFWVVWVNTSIGFTKVCSYHKKGKLHWVYILWNIPWGTRSRQVWHHDYISIISYAVDADTDKGVICKQYLSTMTSRLFTQPFIWAQIKENIKAPRHWPLCGEFTGDRPYP